MHRDKEKILDIMDSLEEDYLNGLISNDKYIYLYEQYSKKLQEIEEQEYSQNYTPQNSIIDEYEEIFENNANDEKGLGTVFYVLCVLLVIFLIITALLCLGIVNVNTMF